MKDKLTKQEIAQRPQDFIHNKYDQGGSRMFVNGESGDRQLLVDTYYDSDFAEYLEECIRTYFELPNKDSRTTLTPEVIESLGWSLHSNFDDKSTYTYEYKGTKYGLTYSKKYPYDIRITVLDIGLYFGTKRYGSTPHIHVFLVTDNPKQELSLLMKQMVLDESMISATIKE